jgi:hypothetical protein
MNFPEEIGLKKVATLHSGHFYWIHAVSRCYRINEVDHFYKDLTTDLFCFLDNQGQCHHFNRAESKLSAMTPLQEILAIPNLKTITCCELVPQTVDALNKGDIVLKSDDEGLILMQKAIVAFYEKQASEGGAEFSLEALKTTYMHEYVQSTELRY